MKITSKNKLVLNSFSEQAAACDSLSFWCLHREVSGKRSSDPERQEAIEQLIGRLSANIADLLAASLPETPASKNPTNDERILLSVDESNLALSALNLVTIYPSNSALAIFANGMLQEVVPNRETVVGNH